MKERIEQTIARALKHVDNDRYILSLVVAKRAKDILSGSQIMISGLSVGSKKATDIALLEVAEGLIEYKGFVDKEV